MDFDTLLEEFTVAHKALRTEKLTVLQRANKGIALCHGTLSKMRIQVYQEGFLDKMEEITFFKDIKSIPMGHLVYYNEVRDCEERLPRLGLKPKLKFLRIQRERINSFNQCHLHFHRYVTTERRDLDAHYFTTGPWIQPPMGTDNYGHDLRFNTSHDVLYAKFKGFERFGHYLLKLEAQVKSLDGKMTNRSMNVSSPFTFTKSPTAAMELIYALRSANAINHGDFEIKAFVSFFSEVLNIEIKDPYGLFKQVAKRKTRRPRFLQNLSDALMNTLDERDNYIP